MGENQARGRKTRITRRRAMSIVVVLAIVAVTLAASYSAMRSQSTMLEIEQNSGARSTARQAAISGLTIALRRMHQNSWTGVGSTLTGSLSSTDSYAVAYTSGDPELVPGHSDYADLPYRVTLTSTGYSTASANSLTPSTHRVQAVVRLAPNSAAAEPSNWDTFQQYTIYQGEVMDFRVELPTRIEGPVRVQGVLKIADGAPGDTSARDAYLRHLELMRVAGYGDSRVFDGPVRLQTSLNGNAGSRLGLMGVPVVNNPSTPFASDWIQPTSIATYRLFPGGPTYNVTTVSESLKDITLAPNPATNPLGLFYNSTTVNIFNNVTIRGTLFVENLIRVYGNNVHFQPFDLPALYGTSTPLRLPTVSCKRFNVESGAKGSVTGLMAVFGRLAIAQGPEAAGFSITGRVIVKEDFFILERTQWKTTDWQSAFSYYNANKASSGLMSYFPPFMITFWRNMTPIMTVKPDPDPVVYHWLKSSTGVAVYVPKSSDAGLYWDLLSWKDGV